MPPTSRSSRVVWLLEELGLPYTVIPVKFEPYAADSDLKRPDVQEASPLNAVPALKDDGTWITESGAITQYILARYGDGKLTPPVDSVDYGLYLQWLWFAEASLCDWATEYVHHKVLRPDDQKVPEVLPVLAAKVEKALAVLEKVIPGVIRIPPLGVTHTPLDVIHFPPEVVHSP
eukprot:jgi/Botrbrau1/14240/Bobra.0381s0003.1